MKNLISSVLLAGFLLLAISCSGTTPLSPDRTSDNSSQSQRWIVLLDDSADPALFSDELASNGKATERIYTHAIKGFSIRLSENDAASLALDSRVKLVEPDIQLSINAPGGVPGKPGGGGGGGGGDGDPPPQVIPSNISRIEADQNSNTGVGTEVAVIDTGITLNHPDLKAHILGDINFVNSKKNGNDDNFHGTHVAGIIGAIDNTEGVVGVAPDTGLWAVKVLDSQGSGWVTDIVAGIDWVTANAGHIDVANMSFSGFGYSGTLHAAIQGMVAAGVTAVAAASNNYSNAANYSPGSFPEVICVSGMRDTNDKFYHWSNYGSVIDLIAPGVSVYSTLPGKKGIPLYGSLSGTSMSAPHVAGAAALYIASNPSATPAQVMAGLQAAGYLPGGGWEDDPLVSLNHPDPDGITEKLVMAGSL